MTTTNWVRRETDCWVDHGRTVRRAVHCATIDGCDVEVVEVTQNHRYDLIVDFKPRFMVRIIYENSVQSALSVAEAIVAARKIDDVCEKSRYKWECTGNPTQWLTLNDESSFKSAHVLRLKHDGFVARVYKCIADECMVDVEDGTGTCVTCKFVPGTFKDGMKFVEDLIESKKRVTA